MRGYDRHPYDMFEILRFTLYAYRVEKLFGEMIRRKFTKADVIKRIMKEHKADFGALLETRQEKIRRTSREKKGLLTVKRAESSEDSEFSWIMKTSDRRLRRITLKNHNELAAPQHKIAIKSAEMHQITKEPEEFSNTPALIEENKSSKIKATTEIGIAPLIKDSELSRVQMRIIHKTSRLKAASKSLPEFVFTTDGMSKMKTEASEKRKFRKIHRSKSTIEVLGTATGESLVGKQFKCSEKADGATISLKSLKESNRSRNAPEMDSQKEAPFLPELQLQNFNEPMLFHRDKEDCIDSWHSSEIISISTKEDKESLKFPSVTRILNATMSDKSKKALELWMSQMIGILGQDGFDKYKRDLLDNGKILHSSIDSTLRKTPFEVPENLQPCLKSLQSVLDKITHIKAIESHVVHRDLGYRGVLDCVASYRGKLCLIDWKKSDKTKTGLSSTYDAPLQIASYIGALNADKNYPFQIKSGLLVIAYTTGNPPTVYELDELKLQRYWQQWLRRLKKYYAMQNT